MCRSLVDIQSATAEIRRGKEEEKSKEKQDKNIMFASAMQGDHNYVPVYCGSYRIYQRQLITQGFKNNCATDEKILN